MIRAVVDLGVLVSAFIGRPGSVPDRIVRAWRAGRIELVVSPGLLEELSGVLARPKFASAAREGRAIDFVEALRVGASLARRGHQVLDTDDSGWIIDSQTPTGSEPLWDLDKAGALLDRHRQGWLFVAGCVANQRALYDRFDAIVLLSALQSVQSVQSVQRLCERRDLATPSSQTTLQRTR